MKTQNSSMQNTWIITGILTACALIGYFLLMKLLNLHQILELRYLNIVFMFIGIRYSLNYIRKNTGAVPYMQGLGAGMLTTLIAVGIFISFMGIYLTIIDPAFMRYIQEHGIFGRYLTIPSVLLVTTLEGTASGGVLTFVMMQYYKRYIVKNA